MVRRLGTIRVALIPLLLLGAAVAGCGGDASTNVKEPPSGPLPGPEVRGTVQLPNGSGSVVSVGRNILVALSFLRNDGNEQGGIGSARTTDQGGFVGIELPVGATEGTPGGRFLLTVTVQESNPFAHNVLTRAFVYSTSDPIAVDYHSEAAVTLILERAGRNGVMLDDFSPSEIRDIVVAVNRVPVDTSGGVEEVNVKAVNAARNDPTVRALLDAASGVAPPATATAILPTSTPTVISSFTVTPTATAAFTRVPTNTPTNTLQVPTATPTSTVPPSATRTQTAPPSSTTPTNTPVHTATNVPPTSTPTNTPVHTATNVPPTSTPTNTPVHTATSVPPTSTPTNTPLDTATSVPPTSTPTNTPVHTATSVPPTSTPTDTPAISTPTTVSTPTPTSTATTAAHTSTPTLTPTPGIGGIGVGVGSASGVAGATVTIPVRLSDGAGQVVATSTDITYDFSQMAVAVNGQMPNCTIDPTVGGGTVNKTLFAAIIIGQGNARTLRVGVVSAGGAGVAIPDGPLFSCVFQIQPGATPGVKDLANVAGASNALGDDLAVTSSPGSIVVGSGPRSIDIGSANGSPGTTVAVPVTLAGGGGVVVATSTDITYNSTEVNAVVAGQTPSCTINPAIGTGSAPNKLVVAAVIPGAGEQRTLRVAVLNQQSPVAIPDGLLFTCSFEIAAGATPGPKVLGNTPGASDAVGNDLDVTGAPGNIAVQ